MTLFTRALNQSQNLVPVAFKMVEASQQAFSDVLGIQVRHIGRALDHSREQTRQLLSIRDMESLSNFIGQQPEVISQLQSGLLEDLKAMGEVATQFRDELQTAISEGVNPTRDESETPAS